MGIDTFVLLTDPQQGDVLNACGNSTGRRRVEDCSLLNVALNRLKSMSYPPSLQGNAINISCGDTPINKPDCVFFAGDLTQFGGNYNFSEQSNAVKYKPHNYVGGQQLQEHRSLYDEKHPKDGIVQLTECGPLYLGLGNHDFQDGTHDPGVGWRYFNGSFSNRTNFYRFQMFNLISQMYTGYKRSIPSVNTDPRVKIPIDNIDSVEDGTYEYMDYSLNYVIELDNVDVYQLHEYGGHHEDGRKSGIDWLKRKLALKGFGRPVIIVQHLLFSEPANFWTPELKDHLLEVLLPYNVIALCVGHDHDVSVPQSISWVNARNTLPPAFRKADVPEIRPGCAFNKNFGLLRVEDLNDATGGKRTRLNVLNGNSQTETDDGDQTKSDVINWAGGWSYVTPAPPNLYVRGIEIVYLDKEDEDTLLLPTLCTELSGRSADINKGFKGKYVYIRPLLTANVAEAISGVKVWHQEKEDVQNLDLAKGTGGEFRYAQVIRDQSQPAVTGLFLLRSDKKVEGVPEHYSGMSDDINEGRKGDYLYLVWRTWTHPT